MFIFGPKEGDTVGKPSGAERAASPSPTLLQGLPSGLGGEKPRGQRSAGRGRGCLGGAPREGPGGRPALGLFVSASRGSGGQGEAAGAGSRVWTGREEKKGGEE